MKEEQKNKIEMRAKHLDEYLNDPLFRRVLEGTTSFRTEVLKFYDVETVLVNSMRGIPLYRTYHYKKELKKNYKESPLKLIEILNSFSFSGERLDESKLKYNLVIEDHLKYKKSWPGRTLTILGHMVGMFGTVGGFCYSFVNPEIGIPVAIGSSGLALYTIYKKPFFLETPNFDEFERLDESSRIADYFVSQHYKNYLINKLLNKKSF